MSNHNRLANIVGAGTLTVLVLALFLLFSRSNTTTTDPQVIESYTAKIAALEAENAELRRTLAAMQTRETAYADQIKKANAVIAELAKNNMTLTPNDLTTTQIIAGAGQP